MSWDGGNPLSYPVRFKGQSPPPFLTSTSSSGGSGSGNGGSNNKKSFVGHHGMGGDGNGDVDVFDRGGEGGFF